MKAAADDLPFWFHETGSCLHHCVGMVLQLMGYDPVDVLGARWSFFHDPAAVSNEEFYVPMPHGSLGDALAPYHSLRADWRSSNDWKEFQADIRAHLDQRSPVIIVEDNFYMPNRPAYNDVHSAHLVVVVAFDRGSRTYKIVEPAPPLYRGPIHEEDLERAVGSCNESRNNSRDFFFAGSEIKFRWISIPRQHIDLMDRDRVVESIAKNRRDFLNGKDDGCLSGLSGLTQYLRDIVERARSARNGHVALSELYTVGWAHQAQAALHADFLRKVSSRCDLPELRMVARLVDYLCNGWMAVRLLGSHGAYGGLDRVRVCDQMNAKIAVLLAQYRDAVDQIGVIL